MKKKKEKILGTPKKRGKFFTFFKGFLRIFTRKPKIINLNEKIEDKAIYLSNHSGSSGPFSLELFFPKYFVPWGTYEMCGGYRDSLIFPENSADGYKTVLEEFFAGFVLLAKTYFKHSGEDLPVYTIYWDKKANTMVIDKPEFCNALLKAGRTVKQVAEFFKDKINSLRNRFILNEKPSPAI